MSFIKDFGHYEWNLIQGSNTLDKSHFSSGTLNDAVFQQFTLGAVVARQLNLTLWNADLNTTDPTVLSCKAVSFDGTETTIPKGTYFIDTLDTSPYSEYSELVAFDAMLKTQVVYMKSGTYTPKTSLQLVQEIASDIGVTIEADTLTFLTNNAFNFTQAPNIGTSEGTTDREILSVIGIYHGGNWIINDNNELELVRAYGSLLGNNLVTVGTDGKFYSTWLAEVEDSTTVVRINSSGKFETILYGSCDDSTVLWYIGRDGKNYTDTLANILANSASDMAVEIGDEVVDFDVSPTEVITRIELVVSNELSYRSPSGLTEEEWQALGGRLVSVNMPLMASQAVADKLYDMYAGLSVVPYESQSAYFSPDVKLGRMLKIKDRKVVLTNRTLTIDSLASSDLILEPQQRLQSNYPYLDPITRQLKRGVTEAKELANEAQASADSAQQTAEGASAREQLIYISVASGTIPTANTTWVTNTSGNQNVWTTKRPVYNSSYPVLYIARQRQTVAQSSGTTCSCTTPLIDETTTIIDGGHITTGTIDANVVTVANINASNINAGTLDASVVDVENLDASNITTGTLSADFIYGGTLTLGGVNNINGQLNLLGSDGERVAGISGTALDCASVEVSDSINISGWIAIKDLNNILNIVYEE